MSVVQAIPVVVSAVLWRSSRGVSAWSRPRLCLAPARLMSTRHQRCSRGGSSPLSGLVLHQRMIRARAWAIGTSSLGTSLGRSTANMQAQ
jgi:hypothetical protein